MSEFIDRLRTLRRKAKELNSFLTEDLRPFSAKTENNTFVRLPTSKLKKQKDVNVTTSCTAFMALALTNLLGKFYSVKTANEIQSIFKSVVEAEWKSSELDEGNAFTSALVLRTAGILSKHKVVERKELLELNKPMWRQEKNLNLEKIVMELFKGVPESLGVQEYEPTTTVGYWFVDAVDDLGVSLENSKWLELAEWGAKEFYKQRSLLAADHDVMMDPTSMIMAACLLARLHRIVQKLDSETRNKITKELPSFVELKHSVRTLFDYQLKSGIWPKYFPLFHYPDVGANYCFSFEFLESVLEEFSDNDVIEDIKVLEGFEKAVTWCEKNRLAFSHDGKDFCGWNSGGQLLTLSKGEPESWATAVVHMFLFKLDSVLSNVIQKHILIKYDARQAKFQGKDDKKWNRFIDIDIDLQSRDTTVKTLIQDEIIEKIDTGDTDLPHQTKKIDHRRSVLLFGPPGTSKTSLVRAVGEKIGWPCIEINPSHFLKDGLNSIYHKADEIFKDLQDLSKVIILFDEMDALVRRRDGEEEQRLDVTQEFLTTSMLPKIATLHDHAQVLFFMATNHRKNFDEAIIRPGRFDLLIFVGTPKWSKKLECLETLWVGEEPEDMKKATKDIQGSISSWGDISSDTKVMLDLFTFSEIRALFDHLRNRKRLDLAFNDLNKDSFTKTVKDWAENYIILRKKSKSIYEEYEDDKYKSRCQ